MPEHETKSRVYLDLTHLGRHVTGIERVSVEQFEKVGFEGAQVIPVRSSGVASMILRQQVLLPLLAILHPRARFVFPGFPPSPIFSLMPKRTTMYVHDTFLITRRSDLSTKARLYTAPQFKLAVRRLTNFFVNSEKTRAGLSEFTRPEARIQLYRPSVANHFALSANDRADLPGTPKPLRLVSLGTVEPRKNYAASVAILDAIRVRYDAVAELHIIGRAGWGEDAARISAHPGVTVHGYLAPEDVKRIMESADVYLCTSHDEGLGLPLLEAQFAGLPVVAPDQPVFREVLGASGTLIDPARPQDAAEKITSLMAKPAWRTVQAQAAVDNVARWNGAAKDDLAAARMTFAEARDGNAASSLSAASAR